MVKIRFSFTVSPNPTVNDTVRVTFEMPYAAKLNYILTSIDGKLLKKGK